MPFPLLISHFQWGHLSLGHPLHLHTHIHTNTHDTTSHANNQHSLILCQHLTYTKLHKRKYAIHNNDNICCYYSIACSIIHHFARYYFSSHFHCYATFRYILSRHAVNNRSQCYNPLIYPAKQKPTTA